VLTINNTVLKIGDRVAFADVPLPMPVKLGSFHFEGNSLPAANEVLKLKRYYCRQRTYLQLRAT
jgi:hypothetical protein